MNPNLDNHPTPDTNPQETQPPKPDTEINPAKPATNTEVDLDTQKTQTYPDKTPPERH